MFIPRNATQLKKQICNFKKYHKIVFNHPHKIFNNKYNTIFHRHNINYLLVYLNLLINYWKGADFNRNLHKQLPQKQNKDY